MKVRTFGRFEGLLMFEALIAAFEASSHTPFRTCA